MKSSVLLARAGVVIACVGFPAGLLGESPSTKVFERNAASVVTITTDTSFGSGVVVAAAGIIATNLHVIEDGARVSVRFSNGDVYDDVAVVDFDARKDLVLLKVKAFKPTAAALGDSDDLKVGERVFAIGAPRRLELTLSEGIVSALRDSGEGYRVVQTSAAISSGSSGGGLFDENGALVAITTFKISGGENLNFAIPINYVRGMIATEPRMTLGELRAKVGAGKGRGASTAAEVVRVPKLANAYASAAQDTALVQQSDDSV